MDNNEILLKTLEKENKLIIENYKKKYIESGIMSIQEHEETIQKYEEEKKKIIEEYEQEKQEKQQLIEEYEQEKMKNQRLEEDIKTLRTQLDSILYSRSYKVTQTIKKVIGRK